MQIASIGAEWGIRLLAKKGGESVDLDKVYYGVGEVKRIESDISKLRDSLKAHKNLMERDQDELRHFESALKRARKRFNQALEGAKVDSRGISQTEALSGQ